MRVAMNMISVGLAVVLALVVTGRNARSRKRRCGAPAGKGGVQAKEITRKAIGEATEAIRFNQITLMRTTSVAWLTGATRIRQGGC